MGCQANHEATRVQHRQEEDQPYVDKGTTNFTHNPPTALTWAVPEARACLADCTRSFMFLMRWLLLVFVSRYGHDLFNIDACVRLISRLLCGIGLDRGFRYQ